MWSCCRCGSGVPGPTRLGLQAMLAWSWWLVALLHFLQRLEGWERGSWRFQSKMLSSVTYFLAVVVLNSISQSGGSLLSSVACQLRCVILPMKCGCAGDGPTDLNSRTCAPSACLKAAPKNRTRDRNPPGTLHVLKGLSWNQMLGSRGFPQH